MDDTRLKRLQEASEWLVRMEDPARTEDDVNAWLRWCDADPDNLAAFETFQHDWQDLDALKTLSGVARPPPPILESVPRMGTVRRFRLSAVAASLAVIAVTAALIYRERTAPPPLQQVAAEATNRSATLPDGSKVILSAKTLVTVDFTGLKRRLELSAGEAFFSVKHDQRHPFAVHAGDIEVIAVGTAFDVRRDNDTTTVTVEEGAVDVNSELPLHLGEGSVRESSWRAEAGYQLTYSSEHHTATIARIDPSKALDWRNGELAYVGEPLAAVIEDINRYSHRKIVIEDKSIAERHFTGTVFTTGVDDWLKAIEQAYPVEVEKSPNGDVILTMQK